MKLTCRHRQVSVIDSRKRPDGSIRRRRKCLKCGVKWTTLEIPAERLAASERQAQQIQRAFERLGSILGLMTEKVTTSKGLMSRLKKRGLV